MVESHCFRSVGKDIGAIVAIIAQESVVAATILWLVQRWDREGRVTSKVFRHIILRHTWEEGTRWSGQPWPLEEE